MATEPRPVDPNIWKACAGTSVRIPAVHSSVYYFPQGHAEQCSFPPVLSPLASSKPLILCRVLAVRFLANHDTDEVYVKIHLEPVRQLPGHSWNSEPLSARNLMENDGGGEDDKSMVSFAKVLTPSDANNGGGFSVPRFCADSIFPPLNFQADPPVQTISVTDVHGVVWNFRHIYRGTPRRHLLTTGWSKFVNHKKLIAGDSVVFIKNKTGKLFVGVRRAMRSSGTGDLSRWSCGIGGVRVKVDEENAKREGFSRNGKGRVSPEMVAEATELAAQDMPFEVVYYPRAGASDFVVRAEVVDSSLNVYWRTGTRVKMAMETEDSSRMTWFQGTVSSAAIPDNGPWRGSPWRMLQVTWDEPEVLQNVKRVCPWQVEYVAPAPPFNTAFPPTKKFRAPQTPGMLNDGERELFFPMAGLTNSTVDKFNPSLLNYDTFPAGMQGARQDLFRVTSLHNFLSEDTHQMCTENFFGKMSPKAKIVSTELNIGSSHSDNLSPDSPSSVHSSGMEIVENRVCNSSMRVASSSFQLFGKIIHMKQSDESGFDDVGCPVEDSSKTVDVMKQRELSTYPYMKLFDRIDVQCQSASSAVEACSL
ncbi:auxin response factor 17 [Malania oleifera]|uniref:auxin response factor 17 n=1 Tax=Malania oleifera TaxID=397392 RepID=UPI0025AE73B1|nr:auxin response factor 17 [Malania oleifera]